MIYINKQRDTDTQGYNDSQRYIHKYMDTHYILASCSHLVTSTTAICHHFSRCKFTNIQVVPNISKDSTVTGLNSAEVCNDAFIMQATSSVRLSVPSAYYLDSPGGGMRRGQRTFRRDKSTVEYDSEKTVTINQHLTKYSA